ncbi:hypothetical protein PR202_ga30660 [Eleusine coracana subsp. coracana]|uniref:Uncharacterized protein n=1 Tax=Eleusine coracana subsp. coracana TaxID=191504 RepID=A0AAV5DQI3_ELECO|nr:hypothetical protein PR202_ga30660 [Eleusine coracana subsp. coracana]
MRPAASIYASCDGGCGRPCKLQRRRRRASERATASIYASCGGGCCVRRLLRASVRAAAVAATCVGGCCVRLCELLRRRASAESGGQFLPSWFLATLKLLRD